MATISRRGMFASVLHPDAEDAVAGATPKPQGVMAAKRPPAFDVEFGTQPALKPTAAQTNEAIAGLGMSRSELPRGGGAFPGGEPATAVGTEQQKAAIRNYDYIQKGREEGRIAPLPAPIGVMASAKSLPANNPTSPVDPVRSGQQAPAAAGPAAGSGVPLMRRDFFDSDGVSRAGYRSDPRMSLDQGQGEADAQGVPLGITMVPVQGVTKQIAPEGKRTSVEIGVPTGQTIGRGVMTARSNSLDRNLDEYGRGQDATPYSPNAATNEIAKEMQAKNAAIDAKAPGILSAMQRRVDPRERASLALEQRFRNVDQPAAEARNATELAQEKERTEGKRLAGVQAAEAGARGVMGAAEATGRATIGAAEKKALGDQAAARVAEITRQADRDFRAALQSDRSGAAAARVVAGLRAQAAKLAVVPKGVEAKDHEENSKVAIQQLNDLAVQYEQEIGQASGGSGGGGLDGIPTWRPTK